MRAAAGTGAGFLLAVLWFDLMFDVQVRGTRGREAAAGAIDSISAYYARVTTAARPMNRLVALAMLTTIGATVAELARDDLTAWRTVPALVLTLAAVGLAAAHTVPNAVRLGGRTDAPAQQLTRARLILRDHVVCFVAIATVIALQLAPA